MIFSMVDIKPIVTWLVRIVVLVVLVKVVLWSWDGFIKSGQVKHEEVIDSDKVCRIVSVDTGQCICRHRLTNEMLDITREACHALAKR